MRTPKVVRGFVRLGLVDGLLFIASWTLLGLTRLMVVALPQSWIRALLGRPASADLVVSPTSLSEGRERIARHIGESITLAARHTPWRSECFPQALTARVELVASRIPHTVSFGLLRDADRQLLAHAWVSAGDLAVTGGDPRDYTVVGTFGWKTRQRT